MVVVVVVVLVVAVVVVIITDTKMQFVIRHLNSDLWRNSDCNATFNGQ